LYATCARYAYSFLFECTDESASDDSAHASSAGMDSGGREKEAGGPNAGRHISVSSFDPRLRLGADMYNRSLAHILEYIRNYPQYLKSVEATTSSGKKYKIADVEQQSDEDLPVTLRVPLLTGWLIIRYGCPDSDHGAAKDDPDHGTETSANFAPSWGFESRSPQASWKFPAHLFDALHDAYRFRLAGTVAKLDVHRRYGIGAPVVAVVSTEKALKLESCLQDCDGDSAVSKLLAEQNDANSLDSRAKAAGSKEGQQKGDREMPGSSETEERDRQAPGETAAASEPQGDQHGSMAPVKKVRVWKSRFWNRRRRSPAMRAARSKTLQDEKKQSEARRTPSTDTSRDAADDDDRHAHNPEISENEKRARQFYSSMTTVYAATALLRFEHSIFESAAAIDENGDSAATSSDPSIPVDSEKAVDPTSAKSSAYSQSMPSSPLDQALNTEADPTSSEAPATSQGGITSLPSFLMPSQQASLLSLTGNVGSASSMADSMPQIIETQEQAMEVILDGLAPPHANSTILVESMTFRSDEEDEVVNEATGESFAESHTGTLSQLSWKSFWNGQATSGTATTTTTMSTVTSKMSAIMDTTSHKNEVENQTSPQQAPDKVAEEDELDSLANTVIADPVSNKDQNADGDECEHQSKTVGAAETDLTSPVSQDGEKSDADMVSQMPQEDARRASTSLPPSKTHASRLGPRERHRNDEVYAVAEIFNPTKDDCLRIPVLNRREVAAQWAKNADSGSSKEASLAARTGSNDERSAEAAAFDESASQFSNQPWQVTVPLEADFTIPLAYYFDQIFAPSSGVDKVRAVIPWWSGLLDAVSYQKSQGLYLLQPFDRDKIPIVFIHGLASNSVTWIPMMNGLLGDDTLRRRYQFLYFQYPTGLPMLMSAKILRQALLDLKRSFVGDGVCTAFHNMVLIGKVSVLFDGWTWSGVRWVVVSTGPRRLKVKLLNLVAC
jgi:hypothetical protein